MIILNYIKYFVIVKELKYQYLIDMGLSEKINKTGMVQIKKKSQEGGKKLSPISKSYKKYLQEGKLPESNNKSEKSKSDKKNISDKKSPKKINIVRKKGDPDIKIIHKKDNKNKHKFTRKKPSKINIKDINEIERQIELSKKQENKKKDIVENIKKNTEVKKSSFKKNNSKKENQTKISRSKAKKVSRGNKKSNKKSNKKKISIKNQKISQKDIKLVESKIKEIRSKKTEDIKKELEKDGIKVSGKSKRLLKDIYLYSKVCNINIQHEK